MHSEGAVAFIRARGTVVERARLGVLSGDVSLVPAARAALESEQRPDGSWAPFWSPDASSVDATCFGLAQAEQLGLHREPFARRAAAFLASRQQEAGFFDEDGALAPVAPPWALPGEPKARMYLTANAAYWLQFLGGAEGQVALAAEWLGPHVSEDGRMRSFLHTHWLAAGLLYGTGAPDVGRRIMRYLLGRLDDLEASNLAWLVMSLRLMGIPFKTPLVLRARERLAALQADDGRWRSEDGEAQDVHATLEALRALDAFGGEAAWSGRPSG